MFLRPHFLQSRLEEGIVGCPPAGRGVPPGDGGEPGAEAGVVGAAGDVLEGVAVLVDERVQEAERGAAGAEALAVELREDGGDDGARRRGPCDTAELARAAVGDAIAVDLAAERRDIGVASSAGVIELGRGEARATGAEKVGDRAALPVGDAEGVAEAAAAVRPGGLAAGDAALGGEVGAPDRRDVRRSSRKIWVEGARAAAGAAPDTLVAQGEEDADTAAAELHELHVH